MHIVSYNCTRPIIAVLLCLCGCQTATRQSVPVRYGQAYSALQSIFALPVLLAERAAEHVRVRWVKVRTATGFYRDEAALSDAEALGRLRADVTLSCDGGVAHVGGYNHSAVRELFRDSGPRVRAVPGPYATD